jgi:DNA-binding NarL/FixJ family response regulator
MITVVIVDDHPVVRAGLKMVLNTATDIRVVGEGGSGIEALQLIERHRPDVLVLDVNLPDLSGHDVLNRLVGQEGSPPVLILTVHDDSQTIFTLLQAGAVGYVLKDEASESLVSAVRAAARGETWLSPSVARQVVKRAVGQAVPQSPPEELPLTPSEKEVLRLLAQGLDNAAIGERLSITKRTVQNHVSAIYGKLNLTSRTEAALFAIRHGLAEVRFADSRASDAKDKDES